MPLGSDPWQNVANTVSGRVVVAALQAFHRFDVTVCRVANRVVPLVWLLTSTEWRRTTSGAESTDSVGRNGDRSGGVDRRLCCGEGRLTRSGWSRLLSALTVDPLQLMGGFV